MIDIRGDGDAIAALLDAMRGLLDARALGRTGRRDDGDPPTPRKCTRRREHGSTRSEGRGQRAEVIDSHRSCFLLPFAFCPLTSKVRSGSVSRILSSSFKERGSFICHSRCRGGRATYPEAGNGNGRFHRFPIWSCSAGGLPCRRRSRGTRGALTPPVHPCHHHLAVMVRRFVLCCPFRRVAAPGR